MAAISNRLRKNPFARTPTVKRAIKDLEPVFNLFDSKIHREEQGAWYFNTDELKKRLAGPACALDRFEDRAQVAEFVKAQTKKRQAHKKQPARFLGGPDHHVAKGVVRAADDYALAAPKHQEELEQKLVRSLDQVLTPGAECPGAVLPLLEKQGKKIVSPEARSRIARHALSLLERGAPTEILLKAVDDFGNGWAARKAVEKLNATSEKVRSAHLAGEPYPLKEVRAACDDADRAFYLAIPPNRADVLVALERLVDATDVEKLQRAGKRAPALNPSVEVHHPETGERRKVLDAFPHTLWRQLEARQPPARPASPPNSSKVDLAELLRNNAA